MSISNTILKPYSSSSSLSSVDEQPFNISHGVIPLTVFDKATHDCHISVFFAFRPPMPSNEVLKDGLSKVLVYYPHLAGRFITDDQGRTCIDLNNAGVRVIETDILSTIAEQLPFDASKDNSHLIPRPGKGADELLLHIQLNRYACGGLVLGFSYHHRVADGEAMCLFFLSWSRIVRGLNIQLLPYHDRLAVSQPRNPPKVEFDHGSIEFKKTSINLDTPPVSSSVPQVESVLINYSSEFINKLRGMICNPHQRYSTFTCLLSHVWKKLTQVRGLDPEESSQVRIAVSGRARISEPAVPMVYFGNLVLWAYPSLTVKELLNESHAYIAKAIHDEVSSVDNRYFKSFIDFGAEIYQHGGGGGGSSCNEDELQTTTAGAGGTLCPDLEVDSWLRFQEIDFDFGGGLPCALVPPNNLFEGILIFIPDGNGGVNVKLNLFAEQVPLFKQISHSITGNLS
ncbi:hypothetical protein MKW94_006181 [Papaver nudicaule]|uniref:Uncharacterized protein n=1 Tax=Papaver nudicaule TaxID=74823 RepID=A0AA41VRC4_PAPNU|nr:hypothetical protein [Papaver nudicaule]